MLIWQRWSNMDGIEEITGCISSCRFFRFSSTNSYSLVLSTNQLLGKLNFFLVKLSCGKILNFHELDDGLREEVENSLWAVHLLDRPEIFKYWQILTYIEILKCIDSPAAIFVLQAWSRNSSKYVTCQEVVCLQWRVLPGQLIEMFVWCLYGVVC